MGPKCLVSEGWSDCRTNASIEYDLGFSNLKGVEYGVMGTFFCGR